MNYQLELRQSDEWVKASKSSDPQKLRKRAQIERAFPIKCGGFRIFNVDRKRLKSGELAGAPKATPRRPAPGVVDVKRLASLAVTHIRSIDQKRIYVFPLGKGHAHTSNQFRKYLFGELTGRTGWLDERDRVKAEEAAERLGYTIIEVDPEEWMFAPDLEEAA